MDTTTTSAVPQAGRREWTGLAVLALPTLLTSLDTSVLFLALPHISADLDPSSTQQLWILDIYALMIAGFLITMGTLGDRIGRRRLLITGAATFGVASVLAAYSTSAEMLIVTRALLGIAGATLMPSTLALISNMFKDPKQRSVAIAAWLSCFMLGIAVGPLAGGLLLDNFWWGSVFLLGVPVMILLIVAAPFLLPEYRNPGAGKLDLLSVALSLAAVMPIVYGIKEFAKDGVGAEAIATTLAGVVFLAVFILRQSRLADPLMDLALFRNRTFAASLGIMLLGSAIMGGITLFISQYLQLVEDLSPIRAGVWLLPAAVALMVSAMASPGLAQRLRPGDVMAAGLAVAVVGGVLLTRVETGAGLALLITGFAVVYFGIGPMAALTTDLVVGSAPPEKAGSASAMSETATQLGVALGVAILGSVNTALYRGEVDGTLPSGLPPEASSLAHDSLAGAVAVAASLPAEAARAVLVPAREAFTAGLNGVGGVIAGTAAVLAIAAVALLRRVPPAGKAPADAADPAPAADEVAAR
ncbi:MFS transporter [Actinomadura flavalba]|uniref:MFS transporter n=1 Tax=Actinomadura flavalba TaxID=1120938 RepID=UPI00036C274A|nr:MFS transporter [Actinomadura flavalba]